MFYPRGLDQADDKNIGEHARREGFLIGTKDADFSGLYMLLGFPPKVIWIRRRNCQTSATEAMLRHHYGNIETLYKDVIVDVLTLF